jgi:hypothetical protein
MPFIRKIFIYSCVSLFFLLIISFTARASQEDSSLQVKGNLISADFRDISISEIFEKLRKEKGIWLKAEPAQLSEKISVNFQNLTLEKGLQRILSSQDYCLHFDSNGDLIGVTIINKDLKEVQRGIAAVPVFPSRSSFNPVVVPSPPSPSPPPQQPSLSTSFPPGLITPEGNIEPLKRPRRSFVPVRTPTRRLELPPSLSNPAGVNNNRPTITNPSEPPTPSKESPSEPPNNPEGEGPANNEGIKE